MKLVKFELIQLYDVSGVVRVFFLLLFWRRGVVVIATVQLHSTKPEPRFCPGSNLARDVSEICDGKNLWQWSRLGIRLDAFRRSTILQKTIQRHSAPGCHLFLTKKEPTPNNFQAILQIQRLSKTTLLNYRIW